MLLLLLLLLLALLLALASRLDGQRDVGHLGLWVLHAEAADRQGAECVSAHVAANTQV
jgi:hypothetical protein